MRRSAYLTLTLGLLFAMLGLAAAVGAVAAQQGTATPGAGVSPCSQPTNATPMASPEIQAVETVVANERATAEANGEEEEEEEEESEATPNVSGPPVCSVTVTMVDIDFNPNEFTIPADQPVLLVFNNTGTAVHDFTLDALDIDVDVDPGQSGSIVIQEPAGDYNFYCEQDAHAAAGMVGIMHVVKQ